MSGREFKVGDRITLGTWEQGDNSYLDLSFCNKSFIIMRIGNGIVYFNRDNSKEAFDKGEYDYSKMMYVSLSSNYKSKTWKSV